MILNQGKPQLNTCNLSAHNLLPDDGTLYNKTYQSEIKILFDQVRSTSVESGIVVTDNVNCPISRRKQWQKPSTS